MKHLNSIKHDSGLRRHFTAIRLALCLILLVFVIGAQAMPGQAAGMVTHQQVLKLAFNLLEGQAKVDLTNLYNNNSNAFLSGAMFPDWGSAADVNGCNHCGNIGEDMHWSPFLAAYINYVKQKTAFPLVDDPQDVAFLMGVIAHDEADIAWHFPIPDASNQNPTYLNNDPTTWYSFLDRAIVNDGSDALLHLGCQLAHFDTAYNYHGCIEYLVDVIVVTDFNPNWDVNGLWYPYSDIEAVYQSMGKVVTNADMDQGVAEQKTLYGLEKTWAFLGNITTIHWIHDNNENNLWYYPNGGMNDMTLHVAAAWQQVYEELSTPLPSASQ